MENNKCYDCGRRFKRPLRLTRDEQDNNESWFVAHVCRQCWDGTILVESNPEYVRCEDCNSDDCARTDAMREEYQHDIQEIVKKRYPSAGVMFLPKSEWGSQQAGFWREAGYL